MLSTLRLRLGLASILIVTSLLQFSARAQEEQTDLFSLVLIISDLHDAKEVMTVFDPNDDGYIDSVEQQRLPWRSETGQFDLNKDGRLTHLEVAVRQAKLRTDAGVTFIDRRNANKFMQRKDRNGNKQLDPDEIALGWPKNPKEFDTNGDGIISLNEIATQFAANRGYRQAVGIEGVDHSEATWLRNQFDKDHDGKLAPDEWQAANLPGEPKQHDENGDGLLSHEEIATLLARHRINTGLSKSDQYQARQWIRSADLNQDGKVTQDELQERTGLSPRSIDLIQFDLNKDGAVTLAEVEESLGKQRKEKGYSDHDLSAARRLMTRHDSNRSHYLEADELLEEAGPGQLSVKLMGTIDANQDRKISLEELARHLASEDQ